MTERRGGGILGLAEALLRRQAGVEDRQLDLASSPSHLQPCPCPEHLGRSRLAGSCLPYTPAYPSACPLIEGTIGNQKQRQM